jgi:hypothetical protein
MAAPRKARRLELARKGEAQTRAEPGAKRGSYPTDTKGRARAAKSRASAAEHEGRISRATEASIDRRADRKLGKTTATRKRK